MWTDEGIHRRKRNPALPRRIGDYIKYNPYYNNRPYYNLQQNGVNSWRQHPLLAQYYIETAVFVDEALYKKYTKEYGRSEPDKLDIFLLSLISNVSLVKCL